MLLFCGENGVGAKMREDKEFLVFEENCRAEEALEVMERKGAVCGVVLSKERIPFGLLQCFAVRRKLQEREKEADSLTVADLMRRDFTVISERIDLDELVKENLEDKTFPMVVIDEDGTFKGLFFERDLIDILHKNLKYTKRILDNIDEGIIAVDENNKIAYINEPWKQIHSIRDDRLIGETITEKFPETRIGDAYEENDLVAGEPLHLNFTGATVIPSYKPIIDDSNHSLGAVAIVKDYSKINNLYIGINQISRLNMLFKSIFDHLKESVFYIDKRFKIIYANREFIRNFDAGPGTLMPDNKIKRIIRDKYKQEKVDSFSREVELAGDEGRKNVSMLGIPIFDAGQSLEGLVVILQDITFIKNLNHEIEKRGHLLEYYEEQINKIPTEMICESEAFKEVVSTALKVACTDACVLIEGENGVGKELVAKLIHNNSGRKGRPFVPINCGAIPESLWESEMFGYEDGAFTGAKRGGKAGLFEMADGGTVFLDEIGELSLSTQVKMLRFLQNMEIAKVGRGDMKKIDVRVVAATNKNLEQLVKENRFREDLYYRLNVVKLEVPPLRERADEIKPMTERFIAMFNERYNKEVSISKRALAHLQAEPWPGNIRQLKNTIEQSVIMCDKTIELYDLPLDSARLFDASKSPQAKETAPEDRWNLPVRVQALEKEVIKEALEEYDYNKSQVIRMLNISRKTFYKKLKDYGL